MNTEKRARVEILSQNRKDLQTKVARIKQTIEKVVDKNTSLAERICTLFREQGITIFLMLTAFSMTVSMIVLACYYSCLWRSRQGNRRFSTKRLRGLEKMVTQANKCTQKTCRKGCLAMPAIMESVVGAILSFLGKAVGFVAEHTWALIVFVAGLLLYG